MKQNFKFSLWILKHESVYVVTAFKVKDTNSTREIDKHIAEKNSNVASMYREEKEINTKYLQIFNL